MLSIRTLLITFASIAAFTSAAPLALGAKDANHRIGAPNPPFVPRVDNLPILVDAGKMTARSRAPPTVVPQSLGDSIYVIDEVITTPDTRQVVHIQLKITL